MTLKMNVIQIGTADGFRATAEDDELHERCEVFEAVPARERAPLVRAQQPVEFCGGISVLEVFDGSPRVGRRRCC